MAGIEIQFSWTTVCRRENGGWKIVRMQATMDPVENVFISTRLKMAKLAYGAGGVVIGALLVIVLRLPGRKPAGTRSAQ